MIAYVDESIRSREKLYVIAAGLVVPADAQNVVDKLKKVPPGRSKRFHWRLEREKIRIRMLDVIRDLQLPTFAAVYCADRIRWSSRGRIQALKGLLWELQTQKFKVSELVIETRRSFGDEEDKKTIFRAKQARIADPELTYSFDSPANPLLWVPDAIAGAVGSSWADGVDRYLDQLGEAPPNIFEVDK